MSSTLRSTNNSDTPQFLAIGHVTRDLQTDSSYTLGGTVIFAALTASRLGLEAAIATRADAHLLAELPVYFPDIALAAFPSAATTTFANQYINGFRTQYLRVRAEVLCVEDVPQSWRNAPIVLFGPVAQELPADVVTLFARRPGVVIAATPQGWLRRWDADGRVWPTPWLDANAILPVLDVLILSHDDLLPFANGNRAEAEALLAQWSLQVPLLVATDGRHGATLFQHGTSERFSAYPVTEVDPTGAGDVFAAAFLYHLHKHGKSRAAVNFANCVASFAVEQVGVAGIPTLERVETRLREIASE